MSQRLDPSAKPKYHKPDPYFSMPVVLQLLHEILCEHVAYSSLPPDAFIYVHHNNMLGSNLQVDMYVGTTQHFSD